MNNKNSNTTTNMCGNKTIIMIEIIKILVKAIMIILVIILINNKLHFQTNDTAIKQLIFLF